MVKVTGGGATVSETAKSGATVRLRGLCLRCHHHDYGSGAEGASWREAIVTGTPLAGRDKLCHQLYVHCCGLGESPSSDALCPSGVWPFDMGQLCPSVCGLFCAVHHKLDSRYQLAGEPVAFYAAIFLLVNLTYFWLIADIFAGEPATDVTPSVIRRMRIRALCTLAIFGAAVVLSPIFPIGGMFLICLCLFIYLRPEAPALPF